jgi:hypothetical protein
MAGFEGEFHEELVILFIEYLSPHTTHCVNRMAIVSQLHRNSNASRWWYHIYRNKNV